MESERMRILNRLQAGEITVDEARELLRTLTGEEPLPASSTPSPPAQPPPSGSRATTRSRAAPENLAAAIRLTEHPNPLAAAAPDFDRLRRRWRWLFALSVIGVAALGGLLVSMTQTAAGQATLSLVCTWPLFVGSVVAALLAIWSRRAQWAQVRVEQQDGKRLRLSLPVPVGLVGSLVGLVRLLAPPARGRLENAGMLLTEMRQSSNNEPLLLDIHDDTGVHVQLYVG